MLRIALLLLLLTFTTGVRCLFAQDDELSDFDAEYKQIILSAAKGKAKSISFYKSYLHTRRTTKVKIKFLNDSVFERRSGLHKSTYVIRRGVFVLYHPKAKESAESSGPPAIDSAGYKVYRDPGTNYSAASYSRYRYDSLGREIDYYHAYWRSCYRNVTRYEGDTVTIKEYWSNSPQSDTIIKLHLTIYCFESYNADSTFFIRTIRNSPQWQNSIRSGLPHASDTRKYITYDEQHRIVAVKREEIGYYTDGDHTVGISNLRVVHR